MDLKTKLLNIKWIFGIIFVAIFLVGCVPKNEQGKEAENVNAQNIGIENSNQILQGEDISNENTTTGNNLGKNFERDNREKNIGKSLENKIPIKTVVTSVSIAKIMDKLDIELVGIIESSAFEIPDRYSGVKKVGSPMNPDIEIIRSLNPDMVLSPLSLAPDLKPKYEQAELDYGFVNLNSVQGMFKAIEEIGELYGAEQKAREILDEYENYMKAYSKQNIGKVRPRVLVLMGLPGSYVVATDKSYVGSLVELSGGINVYQDDEKLFLNINIEDMLKKKPDIILRTAHALPDDVKEMFAKEFAENENWKHFDAVKENRVYDLDYKKFGMTANFEYQEALEDLQEILWKE